MNDLLAFDRASVRRIDADGRLHVERSNISKATVSPYLGNEIPGWRELGLNAGQVYRLLRDPEELAKAAATFNNLPLLSQHHPVNVDDHRPDLVVGSTGTDATFEHPYLSNSLVIWAAKAVAGIEDESMKELSSGYRYRADMTAGTFDGEPYDGVMRDIVGSHVSLVREGRAGPDVVVGDSMENLTMKTKVLTRKAVAVHGALLAHLKPHLAQDAQIDLTPVLANVTAGNFKAKKAEIAAGVRKAVAGKLAQDADLSNIDGLLDTFESVEPAEDAEAVTAPSAAPPPEDKALDTSPEDKIKAMLAGKISDEDLAAVLSLIATLAAPAVDEAPDEKEDMVSKQAMDAAISDAVKVAADNAAKTQMEIRAAERAVRPYVGDLAIACDSAEAVYRAALKTMKVDGVDGIHASALPTILTMQPLPGAAPKVKPLAMDAAGAKTFADMYPDAAKTRAV